MTIFTAIVTGHNQPLAVKSFSDKKDATSFIRKIFKYTHPGFKNLKLTPYQRKPELWMSTAFWPTDYNPDCEPLSQLKRITPATSTITLDTRYQIIEDELPVMS